MNKQLKSDDFTALTDSCALAILGQVYCKLTRGYSEQIALHERGAPRDIVHVGARCRTVSDGRRREPQGA